MTPQQLQTLMPNCPDFVGCAEALNATFAEFEIATPIQQAAFLAQVGHESGDLRAVRENLNYSADALSRVFGKYFPGDLETQYARKPEKIANRVYANRMGNGPEESGDGWRYRGGGYIQLTGKDNYRAFSDHIGIDLVADPELIEEPEYAAMSAGFWWMNNNANRYAPDVLATSRLVNLGNPGAKGMPNGYDDRVKRFEKAKALLGA